MSDESRMFPPVFVPKGEVAEAVAAERTRLQDAHRLNLATKDERIAELERENAELRKRRDEEHERFLTWRGIVDGNACQGCSGSGWAMYGTTSTWRGGAGGSTITGDVCDKCWGSGVATEPWINWRELAALREDRERLDWLEGEADAEERARREKRTRDWSLFRRNQPITRDAIDAARGKSNAP